MARGLLIKCVEIMQNVESIIVLHSTQSKTPSFISHRTLHVLLLFFCTAKTHLRSTVVAASDATTVQ